MDKEYPPSLCHNNWFRESDISFLGTDALIWLNYDPGSRNRTVYGLILLLLKKIMIENKAMCLAYGLGLFRRVQCHQCL